MNDLQTLNAALAQDEPSQEVVDRSRHRLQNHMRGGRVVPKRTTRLAVGAGLTAVAAAVVAVSAVPEAPVDSPSVQTGTGPPARTVTGQEILLAAASAAEQASPGTGTYWYVKVTSAGPDRPTDVYEYWTKPDGQWWFRGAKSNGRVMPMVALDSTPFSLVGAELTLDQLRTLPTHPQALTAWIAHAIENGGGHTSAGPLRDVPELLAQATFDSLISLVSTLPAPPAVRAAAFRAIASYPGVQHLGAVPGGQGLLLPGGQRLIVDPATGRVNGTSTFVTADGGTVSIAEPGTATITADWTDNLPS